MSKLFLFFLMLVFALISQGQVTSTTADGRKTEPAEVEQKSDPEFFIIKARENETITTIASYMGFSITTIAEYNNIPADKPLKPDEEIKIPFTKKISEELKKFDAILSGSGKYFKSGLVDLQDNRPDLAREAFNSSIEVFLLSGINIYYYEKFSRITGSFEPKFLDCYNLLIETVYRIEFPNKALVPQIRSLSATCGWNIDNDMADKVAKLVLTAPRTRKTPLQNSLLIPSTVQNSNRSSDSMTGFTEQKFEPSPLDELAKSIPSEKEEKSKKKNNSFTLPNGEKQNNLTTGNIRTVKAVTGDTVAKLADRYGVKPIDVANLNGFASIDSPLAAGRDVKIPLNKPTLSVTPQPKNRIVVPDEKGLGAKPKQFKDGKVQAVMDYFNENLNDPYSMRFVSWSDVEAKTYLGKTYWSVRVKFRAKNSFGAYELSEMIFYIKNNKVAASTKLTNSLQF